MHIGCTFCRSKFQVPSDSSVFTRHTYDGVTVLSVTRKCDCRCVVFRSEANVATILEFSPGALRVFP